MGWKDSCAGAPQRGLISYRNIMIDWRMYCSEARIQIDRRQKLTVDAFDVVEESVHRGAESSSEKSLFASIGHLDLMRV